MFTGTRADVPGLMLGAMDAFLFPSLWEGLPIAFLEAQTAGLRCVVSDAVTPEARVLPESIQRVPLAAGVSEWSRSVLRALEQNRLPLGGTLEKVQESDFAIASSSRRLLAFYRQASGWMAQG